MYGMSYNHMGAGWPTDTLNKFLQRLGAQVLFETLRDGAREERQTDGLPKWQSSYALADSIAPHPATSGVRHYWYVVGTWYYGPLTRPLALSSDWTALVRSSPGFKSTPFPDTFWADGPPTPAVSGVKEKTAVIYAVRQYGRGRIVLNGGESTISFFGYGYSPYADRVWGRIGMEAGLKGIKSDGLQLFVASLRWLVQPSQGNFGGYIPPVKPPFQPKVAAPIQWDRPAGVGGDLPYKKGVLGAQPAVGGGSGSIAQWVGAAKGATPGIRRLRRRLRQNGPGRLGPDVRGMQSGQYGRLPRHARAPHPRQPEQHVPAMRAAVMAEDQPTVEEAPQARGGPCWLLDV